MRKKRSNGKKKRQWKKMEISKVELNSEQAGLTCCNSTHRGQQAILTGYWSKQCTSFVRCYGGTSYDISS